MKNKYEHIDGLRFGDEAMQKCGMQPQFAEHILQLNKLLGTNCILRAGEPPVYNQHRGPKTGLNLTKTSNHGLLKGSLAAEEIFTRIDSARMPLKHHKKDSDHLKLDIKAPDYQHTLPLPVTMQDILRELGDNGDLKVEGCDEGTLRLAYREGKGPNGFEGQFVIDLKQGDPGEQVFSRYWDHPKYSKDWNDEHQVITKPTSLELLNFDLYKEVFNHTFTVGYTDNKTEELSCVKHVMVFANTPRGSPALLNAIEETTVLDEATKQAISEMNEKTPRKDILAALSDEQLKKVYDRVGLAVTGDWDGLALSHPEALLKGFNPDLMRVYSTFGEVGLQDREIGGLILASQAYLKHLKTSVHINEDPDYQTEIESIWKKIPEDLFPLFASQRAGCITPHEFVYQQILNYVTRTQITPTSLSERVSKRLSKVYTEEKLARTNSVNQDSLRETLKRELSPKTLELVPADRVSQRLSFALERNASEIPVVKQDNNVQDLFQHGFDMRNPYGSNLAGGWLMLTKDNEVIHGDTEDQLIAVLLQDKFLEENIIPVSHGADMKKWGPVVFEQLKLEASGFKQEIPYQTRTEFLAHASVPQLAEYTLLPKNKNYSDKSNKPDIELGTVAKLREKFSNAKIEYNHIINSSNKTHKPSEESEVQSDSRKPK